MCVTFCYRMKLIVELHVRGMLSDLHVPVGAPLVRVAVALMAGLSVRPSVGVVHPATVLVRQRDTVRLPLPVAHLRTSHKIRKTEKNIIYVI